MKRNQFFIEIFSFMHCILLRKLQTFYHNKLGAMTLFSKFCTIFTWRWRRRKGARWLGRKCIELVQNSSIDILPYTVIPLFIYQKRFSNNVWLKFSRNFRPIHGNTPGKYMGVGYAKEHDDDINHPLVWLNRVLFKS